MNRIDHLFKDKAGEILSVYITAGYPGLDDTADLLRYLQQYGADMVEIGIPFSDPLADGPVIQHSSHVALQNGMSLKLLFSQLSGIRDALEIPLVMMGYLNPVLRFGMEDFLRQCSQTGIDGVIIPDLPPEIYDSEYRALFNHFHIHHPLLVTPHTPDDRIREITRLSGGFIYLVAEASTTGARASVKDHQIEYFRRIERMKLPVPAMVGFGISNHETFKAVCAHARGAIIGSAFIEMLGPETGQMGQAIGTFVRSIRSGPDR